MKSERPLPAARLWAVSCYFNPCGYRRRAANYQIFRRRLQVPLLTVELSFTDEFELRDGDADLLIQLRADDVMWQKERLLNIGIDALPASCDRVAWIDCDVVFGDDDWPSAANAALDRHPVIQPFATSREVLRDTGIDDIDVAHSDRACHSLAAGLADGVFTSDIMRHPDKRGCGSMQGLAWAARREILQQHYLYDACIMGGGDGAIAAGALGNFEDLIHRLWLNPRRREHFLAWARPFHDTVRADFGHCPGTIFHLWHGDLADRQYLERRQGLAEFDPYTDIAVDRAGLWRWNSDKPALHRFARSYFSMRFEDGRPDSVATDPRAGAGR